MKELESNAQFKVIQYSTNGGIRFRLEDLNGVILDDAQGYGYKTMHSASKAGWYKFKNGKNTIDYRKKAADKFMRQHSDIVDDINYIRCNALKENASEEETNLAIIELLKSNNLTLPIESFKYLV